MWSAGRTQFHQPTVNHVLLKYQSELLDGQDHRVFVPLCGKSVDLVWLSQNEKVKEVIGNEAVSKAVAEFAEENTNLGLEVVPAEQPFKRFVSPLGLTVLQGDHFFLSPAVTGTVDRIWDRASLVAINPAGRVKYVEVLDALLRPEGKILLVSLHRAGGDAEAVSKGPPFSVTEDDVRALFDAERYDIRKLLSQELINDPGYKRFVEAGLTSLLEEAYIIHKRR